MADITSLREGIAANLGILEDVQVSAYMLANPTPPAVQVVPGDTDFHQAMGNGAEWWYFTVQAFVALVNDVGGQKRLDAMLASSGPESIRAAIESDPTLDGECDDLIVDSRTGYRIFVVEGRGEILGAEWTVRVLT